MESKLQNIPTADSDISNHRSNRGRHRSLNVADALNFNLKVTGSTTSKIDNLLEPSIVHR